MLFQEVHYKKLVKYKKYYFIKDEFNKINISTSGEYLGKNIHGRRIFRLVGSTKKFRRNPEPWALEIVHGTFCTKIWINPLQIKFYLKITRKEYNEKLKEKFQETALKIVLKRLINEDFEWI
jgi:hypothetical protein